MKRILLIILASILLTDCEERDRDKGVNPNILPEATQKGANTAGCKVDGKVWVVSRNYIPKIGGGGTYVEKNGGYEIVRLNVRKVFDEGSQLYIKIYTDSVKINKKYIFIENDSMAFSNRAMYIPEFFGEGYLATKGHMIITHLDRDKKVVSGTFEFEAKNREGRIIKITQGRFDKRYNY